MQYSYFPEFHINTCEIILMLLRVFLSLVVVVRTTMATIGAGAVLLKPCGVLEMEASWVDSPKDGSYYNILLLTTIQSTGIVFMHRRNNLIFNGTSMSYRIGEYNKNLFSPGNPAAGTSTFQGFKLNNNYRVFIQYYNAANVYLNQAEGMSLFASPMIQASAPQVQCIKSYLYFYVSV